VGVGRGMRRNSRGRSDLFQSILKYSNPLRVYNEGLNNPRYAAWCDGEGQKHARKAL